MDEYDRNNGYDRLKSGLENNVAGTEKLISLPKKRASELPVKVLIAAESLG
ncbi:MAG: hypothetical protein ACRYFZ_10915 [Janthinobacterium lividum]